MTRKSSLDWAPTSEAETSEWEEQDAFHLSRIAKSPFCGPELIRRIATHSWQSDAGSVFFLPCLAENPNLDLNLVSWLDATSTTWSKLTQLRYWQKRYGVSPVNSNHNFVLAAEVLPKSFPQEMLDEQLSVEDSSRLLVGIVDQFLEQMWHDLAVSQTLQLYYIEDFSYVSDFSSHWFGTSFGHLDYGNILACELQEELRDALSPGVFVSWIARRIFPDHELMWNDFIQEANLTEEAEPFEEMRVGNAIFQGIKNGDIENVNEDVYWSYLAELEEIYIDSSLNLNTIQINSKPPWNGLSYSELSIDQKSTFIRNLVTSLAHPFLGEVNGISQHLLFCLMHHEATPLQQKSEIEKELLAASSGSEVFKQETSFEEPIYYRYPTWFTWRHIDLTDPHTPYITSDLSHDLDDWMPTFSKESAGSQNLESMEDLLIEEIRKLEADSSESFKFYLAVNALVAAVLIPKNRFVEAAVWCEQLLVKSKFPNSAIAEENFRELHAKARKSNSTPLYWEYSNNWRQLDGIQIQNQKAGYEQYLALLQYFERAQGMLDTLAHEFEANNGMMLTSLTNSMVAEFANAGVSISHDTVARAVLDHLTHTTTR